MSIAGVGAVGDGTTLNTVAIQKAIDQLAANGGGTLEIPQGNFLSGAIYLKPGVNLHFDKGAVLQGSTNIADYPELMTRIEGHFQVWIPALLNASNVDHLRITGEGTIQGGGQPYWDEFWAARAADKNVTNLAVKRPRNIFIRDSKDVLVSGFCCGNLVSGICTCFAATEWLLTILTSARRAVRPAQMALTLIAARM